jgi:hypothetical protein
MDPRVCASLRSAPPEDDEGKDGSVNRQGMRFAESLHDFVILGRSRSEANCADPRIHA